MSLVSIELEQIKSAQGGFNKLLLLIVTGRLTALLALFAALLTVALLGLALFVYPAQAENIIQWLGIIGGAMGITSQATSLGHSALNKLRQTEEAQPTPAQPSA